MCQVIGKIELPTPQQWICNHCNTPKDSLIHEYEDNWICNDCLTVQEQDEEQYWEEVAKDQQRYQDSLNAERSTFTIFESSY